MTKNLPEGVSMTNAAQTEEASSREAKEPFDQSPNPISQEGYVLTALKLASLSDCLANDYAKGHYSMADAIQTIRGLTGKIREMAALSTPPATSPRGVSEDRVDLLSTLEEAAIQARLCPSTPNANVLATARKNVCEALAGSEVQGVSREIAEGSGFWRSCSGCHETFEGHDVGDYPFSPTFQCKLGGGCSECGGIGDVWDTTDYEAMANEMASGMGQTVSSLPTGSGEGLAEARQLLEEARDLLMERIYGNPARSPGHNARLKVETALAALSTPSVGGFGGSSRDLASDADAACVPDGTALVPSKAVVGWLVTHKDTGETRLSETPLADLPHNRARWWWEPLVVADHPHQAEAKAQ